MEQTREFSEIKPLSLSEAVETKLRDREIVYIQEKSVVTYQKLEEVRQQEGANK